MTCYLGLALCNNPCPSPAGSAWVGIPSRREHFSLPLSFSPAELVLPLWLRWALCKGKITQKRGPSSGRGGSSQAPPAREEAWEGFSFGLLSAFPFESAELAQTFPSCRGKLAKNHPEGLKNPKVVILQGRVCAGHGGVAVGSPTAHGTR